MVFSILLLYGGGQFQGNLLNHINYFGILLNGFTDLVQRTGQLP